jgi:hypothetical protein
MESHKITVSDEFLSIYKNFNVFDQVHNMKKLSKLELYLIIILCLDKHDECDIVINNIKSFLNESIIILDFLSGEPIEDPIINELIEITGSAYIDTDIIFDRLGNPIPEPYTKSEIRNAKIDCLKII